MQARAKKNPIISGRGVCDPHVHIFGDRAYLYASHDRPEGGGLLWNGGAYPLEPMVWETPSGAEDGAVLRSGEGRMAFAPLAALPKAARFPEAWGRAEEWTFGRFTGVLPLPGSGETEIRQISGIVAGSIPDGRPNGGQEKTE